MPLLIGVFLGVPVLAREHEQRTLLLAWSQDVSPARWLWTKLALLGLFVAALTTAVAGVSDHLARRAGQGRHRRACSSTRPSSTPAMLPAGDQRLLVRGRCRARRRHPADAAGRVRPRSPASSA